MPKYKFVPNEVTKQLLRDSGSSISAKAFAATRELAKALELPLRQAVLSGDITGPFSPIRLEQGATAEFPLDAISPGTEKDFVAYTIPNHGYIPQRHVEGNFIVVPVYPVGAAIDWLLRYARDARWDIVGRMMEVMQAQFVKKFNDDAWHVIIAAGVDRNILVYDSDATAGQLTKRLVSLMKTTMRRNGGGNSTSLNRGKLTDLYISPESMEDLRNWGVDQVDEITRHEIYIAGDGDSTVNRIFGVNLHDIDELGVGQEYQAFFTNDLSGSMGSSDVEIVVGLDESRNDSFVHPIREEVQIFTDENLHREMRAGLYGWAEGGWAVLDNRRVLVGSL